MATVLVVDDERDIREAIAEVLRLEGYEVLAARDGAEGLRQLRVHRPSLVLLDLMMPGTDGWEFLAARRREPELAAVPVIVVSALGRAPRGEAAAYLPKPFALEALVAAVRRLAAPGGADAAAGI